MNGDRRVVWLLVLAVAAVGVVVAGPGAFDAPERTADGGAGTDGTPGTTEAGAAELAFEIDGIEECGLTCRNVTATLSNVGDGTARNVTVNTTLYADDRPVWNASRNVGRIGANESYTATERVTVDVDEAQAIQENEGYATVVVEVTFDEGRARFERRREVV